MEEETILKLKEFISHRLISSINMFDCLDILRKISYNEAEEVISSSSKEDIEKMLNEMERFESESYDEQP